MNSVVQPPAQYGRLARTYSFWEYLVFVNRLQRCRLHWWKELASADKVLLLGDGNGRFSTHLLEKFPNIHITSLDVSSAMLRAARKRRNGKGLPENRIAPIREDIRLWSPENSKFDAVVAQFFFDCFEEGELKQVVTRLKCVMDSGAKLLVSEFHNPGDTRIGHWRARLTLGILYPIFAMITGLKTKSLEPHTPILLSQGFKLKKESYFSNKTLVTQVFER